MSDRLTVAIVTRDRPELFARCAAPTVEAAVERGHRALVVDQSRSDGGPDAVAAGAAQVLRGRTGLSRGRNLALEVCRTELLAFTDDDVQPTETWSDDVLAAFADDEVGAVCGRGRFADGSLMSGGPPGAHRWPVDPFRLGSGYSLAVRTQAARSVGGFDERLGAGAPFGSAEDTDMLYRLLRAGWTVVCSDEVQVTHVEWRGVGQEWRRSFRYGLGTGAMVAKDLGDRLLRAHARRRLARQWQRQRLLRAEGDLAQARVAAAYLVGFPAGLLGGVLIGLAGRLRRLRAGRAQRAGRCRARRIG